MVVIPQDIRDVERAAELAEREANNLRQLAPKATTLLGDAEAWAARLRLIAKRMEGK